jgi:hypothetical protein
LAGPANEDQEYIEVLDNEIIQPKVVTALEGNKQSANIFESAFPAAASHIIQTGGHSKQEPSVFVEFCTTNATNSRIAIVTTDKLTRVQQLWTADTLELIWTYQQRYHSTWNTWPIFSPKGLYVAVHDGNSTVFMIDTLTMVEALKVEINSNFRGVLSLAVSDRRSPRAQVALAAIEESPIFQKNYDRLKYIPTFQRSDVDIMVVPSAPGRQTSLRYATSKDNLFVINLDMSSNRLSIETFDTIDGGRNDARLIGNVLTYSLLGGPPSIAWHDENCFALEVTTEEPVSKFSVLLRRRRKLIWRRSVWIMRSEYNQKFSYELYDATSQAMIWQGKLIIVDAIGEIKECDGLGRSTIAWANEKVSQSRIVAFCGIRLILLGTDGILSFADTTPRKP